MTKNCPENFGNVSILSQWAILKGVTLNGKIDPQKTPFCPSFLSDQEGVRNIIISEIHFYMHDSNSTISFLIKAPSYNKSDFRKNLEIARIASFGRTSLIWFSFDRNSSKLFKWNKIFESIVFYACPRSLFRFVLRCKNIIFRFYVPKSTTAENTSAFTDSV